MEIFKFFAIVIIGSIIFLPIDKKYGLHSKYHDHSNKRFRFILFMTGLLSMAIVLFISFLSDNFLKLIGVNRDLLFLIFGMPMIFCLFVAIPQETPS